jgi:hypothetical protein
MNLEDIDPKATEFTDSELDFMGQILMKAEAIRADSVLLRTVQKHMKGRAKEIRSIAQLRDKASEAALAES